MPRFLRRNANRQSLQSNQRHASAHGNRAAELSLERLEPKIVLSVNPSLAVSGPLSVAEGTELMIEDIGVFSDEVAGGGTSVGLDPNAFASLGAFDPTADVVFDTDALTIDGTSVAATTVSLDTGAGPYDVAVFTFDSFELDAGLTLTGTGSRPLAILAQTDISVAGTIDVSASVPTGGSIFTNGERIAGPGGGDGGNHLVVADLDGSPAAGAPVTGIGLGDNSRGGGGGAFGGDGGDEGLLAVPAGKNGLAYGDLSLGIQGGSGGGAVVASNQVSGGGGGGGIELGANGNIAITGAVLADGGASGLTSLVSGGGGGGGGILVHGADLTVTGMLSAQGGDSDIRPDNATLGEEGGAGGGGRILLAHAGSVDTTGSLISVAAGVDGGLVETMGEDGVFTVIPVTSTPVIETYDYIIDWGDGTASEVGVPDIDVAGGAGVDHEGSLDGSHTYVDNGLYEVMVTVNDSGGGSATESFFVTVDNRAPEIFNLATDSAAIGGLGEGDLVTLTADFTDAGLIDTHTATIDWGDGSTSNGVVDQNAGTITADHVYTQGGLFDVTLSLVDNDTGLATDTTGTVIAGVGLSDGVLQIVGSNDNDFAKVYKNWNGNQLQVWSKIGDGPSQWESFATSSVTEIDMLLGGGHDLGFVSSDVGIDATLDGGAGDDLLIGGRGNDVVLGGAGYDALYGGRGRDLLIGGADSDLIVGNRGQDILIAGTTAFDGDRAARDAIMAEWNSSRDYQTRVDNLTNTGVGADFDARLNGDFFLIAAGAEATVFDDEAADVLIGKRGRDLYFANLDGGVEDAVLEVTSGEIIEELPAAGV